MYDVVGVEIKKGDLLLNFYTYSSGGVYHRYEVAVDFTDYRVVVGAAKKAYSWSQKGRRPTIKPENSVVVNHKWKDGLKMERITATLSYFKIEPNLNEHRMPSEKTNTEITEPKEDLSEI